MITYSESFGKTRTVNQVLLAWCGVLLIFIHALAVSKVVYCYSVLAIVSGHLLDRLQSVFNIVTRSRSRSSSVSSSWHTAVSVVNWCCTSLRAFIERPSHLPPQQSLFRPLSVQPWASPLHKCGTVHQRWPFSVEADYILVQRSSV